MSYANYPRRAYSNAPYRSNYQDPNYVDHQQQPFPQQGYSQQGYQQDDYNQQPYPQQYEPDSYTSYAGGGHDGRHRHHRSGHHSYTTLDPRYLNTSSYSRHHHPSSYHTHSRHSPQVIVGGRYSNATYLPSSSSRSKYRVYGGGASIPIVTERSYRDDFVSLATRIRRLFGLGPKHRSGHRGVAVHIKRGSDGKYSTTTGRTRQRVYTL